MRKYGRRLLMATAAGTFLAFAAQLASRNFYLTASVELASEADRTAELQRTIQALESRIAYLESPSRLSAMGKLLDLHPLPVESFVMAEVAE